METVIKRKCVNSIWYVSIEARGQICASGQDGILYVAERSMRIEAREKGIKITE